MQRRTAIACALLSAACAVIAQEQGTPAPVVMRLDAALEQHIVTADLHADPRLASAGAPGAPGAPGARGEAGRTGESRDSVVVAPIPMADPARGLGLGLVGVYAFRPPFAGEDSPDSILAAGGFYQDSGSWGAGLGGRVHTKSDRWRLSGGTGRFDLRYDVALQAADAQEDASLEIPFRMRADAVVAQALYRLRPKLYAGVRLVWSDLDTGVDIAEENLPPDLDDFEDPSVNLRLAGLGLVLQVDTRDSTFFPRSGSLTDLSADTSEESFGSDITYQRYTLNHRRYLTVRDADVLAYQGYVCAVGEEAPFFTECQFGTDGVLRGYAAGQHYGPAMFGLQAEYRWQVFERWWATGFAGVGGVAEEFGDLNADELLPAAGVGVRFVAAVEQGITVRLDYAWGEGDSGFYVSIGEAF